MSHSSVFYSEPSKTALLPSADHSDKSQSTLETAMKSRSENSALTDVLRAAKKVEVIDPQSVQRPETLWAENEKNESADAYSSPSQAANSQESPSADSPTVVSASSGHEQENTVPDQKKS